MAFKLTVEKLPSRIGQTTVNLTRYLLEDMLLELDYDGNWKLKFAMQLRQKNAKKFKVVRQEGRAIRIRTKPGNNESCWESILTPPENLLTQDVVETLKKVHPTKLNIPAPPGVVDPTVEELTDRLDELLHVEPVPPGADVACGWNKGRKRCEEPAVQMLITPEREYATCAKHMTDPSWFDMIGLAKRIKGDFTKELPRLAESAKSKATIKKEKQAKKEARKQAKIKELVEEEKQVKKQRAEREKELADKRAKKEAEDAKRAVEEAQESEEDRKARLLQEFEDDTPEEDFSLEISRYTIVEGLRDSAVVLSHALYALNMDAAEGQIRRKDATESITFRLGLEEYVENSTYTLTGACREIINGLVQHEFIERMFPENSPAGIVRKTASGYKITQKGYDRLNGLQPIVEEEPGERRAVMRAEQKKDDLVPLAEKLQSLQNGKGACLEEIENIMAQRRTHKDAMAGIEAQLTPLREQIIELQDRLADHEDKIETLDGEISYWQEESVKSDTEIETLKHQIEELLQ
jgi:hypothetical protein